ncbi:type IV pilus assembly protein PilN [Neisseria sp. HSC-16F19]|nr:PilN domain-containing protein [Neisseria sp. HSC-16F19]MCP2041256.1 type IV pilus assembly protein PilN [Neisseria sp. HSC-16F19]
MISMIKINLLPYREARLQKQKQQFKSLMLACALGGVLAAGLGWFYLNNSINSQTERNQLLTDGITRLDTEIQEIEKLELEKANFLSRKQKVEELETQRFEAARLLDTLNTVIPEGVYLTGITGSDALNYNIQGKAISDSKIAVFMRAIPGTGLFSNPELVSIKKANDSQEFVLKVSLNRQPAAAPAAAQ